MNADANKLVRASGSNSISVKASKAIKHETIL